MASDGSTTPLQPCPTCGERFRGAHDCDLAMEARALFEAGKRANDRDSAGALTARALVLVIEADRSRHATY